MQQTSYSGIGKKNRLVSGRDRGRRREFSVGVMDDRIDSGNLRCATKWKTWGWDKNEMFGTGQDPDPDCGGTCGCGVFMTTSLFRGGEILVKDLNLG